MARKRKAARIPVSEADNAAISGSSRSIQDPGARISMGVIVIVQYTPTRILLKIEVGIRIESKEHKDLKIPKGLTCYHLTII
jgi:hypothetical protein